MTKQEALEELDSLCIPRDGEQDRLADAFEMAYKALESQKSGKWVVDRKSSNIPCTAFYIDVHCSICGFKGAYTTDKKDDFLYSNYCPSCGAKMEVES